MRMENRYNHNNTVFVEQEIVLFHPDGKLRSKTTPRATPALIVVVDSTSEVKKYTILTIHDATHYLIPDIAVENLAKSQLTGTDLKFAHDRYCIDKDSVTRETYVGFSKIYGAGLLDTCCKCVKKVKAGTMISCNRLTCKCYRNAKRCGSGCHKSNTCDNKYD